MKPPSGNALLEALTKFGKAIAKKPAGKDWYTVEQLARTQGVSIAAIKYRIRMAQRRGIGIDVAPGTVVDDEGRVVRCAYYRLGNRKP